MLETQPLLQGTYPIIASLWPGLWRVHTHYGNTHINASLDVTRAKGLQARLPRLIFKARQRLYL